MVNLTDVTPPNVNAIENILNVKDQILLVPRFCHILRQGGASSMTKAIHIHYCLLFTDTTCKHQSLLAMCIRTVDMVKPAKTMKLAYRVSNDQPSPAEGDDNAGDSAEEGIPQLCASY